MVSYNSILHVCELCGDEVCREFFGEPSSSPHELNRSRTTPVSAAASFSAKFLNEATIDLVLLAAVQQFEDQATNRLKIAACMKQCEDSGTTQKKKTPGNIACKHVLYTFSL